MSQTHISRSGEIGRRSRLKICRLRDRAGSIPASGTTQKPVHLALVGGFFLCPIGVKPGTKYLSKSGIQSRN
jgi:hypothetical protein